MIGFILMFAACGEKEDTATTEPSTEVEPTLDTGSGDTNSGDTDSGDTDSGDTDTGSTEIQRCEILSVDTCGERSDCTIIQGVEMVVNEQEQCYSLGDSIDVGCMAADMMCTEAIAFAADPNGGECTWFNNGCFPYQWETCEQSLPECPQ